MHRLHCISHKVDQGYIGGSASGDTSEGGLSGPGFVGPFLGGGDRAWGSLLAGDYVRAIPPLGVCLGLAL
ncbi:MAG: hypothetical protein LBB80_07570 [Treponema sp.]|nr:hypothetical protein [Treponema sp.]